MSRILIFSTHPLFGQGVERLLRREAGLVVVGVESDIAIALHKIAELKPDIVVLDSSDPNCDPVPILSQVLHGKARVTLIGLNLSDNMACVCSVEHKIVGEVSDLLDILQPAVSTFRTNLEDVRV